MMMTKTNEIIPAGWDDPLTILRRKWNEIPTGNDLRQTSSGLLQQDDASILAQFERARQHDTEGAGYGLRGWYHDMYRLLMPGRKVLDVGCGMGISTITFAEMGARLTFTDIISDNVELVRRICRIKGIAADFLYIDRFEDFDNLPNDFDIVTAIGSLINAPASVIRDEMTLIKKHLRPRGRWLHFAYPKSRWVRDGSLPFTEWGECTDGVGTPWMEYHDRAKVEWLFAPSEIRIIFDAEWNNNDFNWFDIELVMP